MEAYRINENNKSNNYFDIVLFNDILNGWTSNIAG